MMTKTAMNEAHDVAYIGVGSFQGQLIGNCPWSHDYGQNAVRGAVPGAVPGVAPDAIPKRPSFATVW